jgi:hypothetical protein
VLAIAAIISGPGTQSARARSAVPPRLKNLDAGEQEASIRRGQGYGWSDSVAEEAAAVFAAHALRIRERLPQVEVGHHGSTCVPGLLTSGDVDLPVRADEPWLEHARELLAKTPVGRTGRREFHQALS